MKYSYKVTKYWKANRQRDKKDSRELVEGYKLEIDGLVLYQEKGTRKPYCWLTEERTGTRACTYHELMENIVGVVANIKAAMNNSVWRDFNVMDLPIKEGEE